MHKGLYWSQLITGIGIGLIIAALVWIYVPRFFPGLEPALNQMAGIEGTNETTQMTDSDSPDSQGSENNYSHLFEEPEETDLADANKEQTELEESQQPAPEDPQPTEDASHTDLAMLENEPDSTQEPTDNNEVLSESDPTVDVTVEEPSSTDSTGGQAQDVDQTQVPELEIAQDEKVTSEVPEKPEVEEEQVTEPATQSNVATSDTEGTEPEKELQDQPLPTEVAQKGDEDVQETPASQPEETDAEQVTDEQETQEVASEAKPSAGFTAPELPGGPKVVTLADLKVFEVEIEYGDTAKDVAKKLEQFGLAHRKDFLKLISLQNLERKLKVGKYYIKNGTSLVDLIDELTSY